MLLENPDLSLFGKTKIKVTKWFFDFASLIGRTNVRLKY